MSLSGRFLAEQGKKPGENGREGEGASSSADADSGGGKAPYDPTYGAGKSDKNLPFLDEDMDLDFGQERKSEVKQPSLSARDLAEERFGKWDDSDYPSTNQEPPEDVEEELKHMEEELYLSRKQAARKEERSAKKKEKKKNRTSPTSPTPPSRGSEGRTRPLFPVGGRDDSPPPRSSGKRDEDLNFTIKSFQDEGEG